MGVSTSRDVGQLLASAQQGDDASLGQLFDKHHSYLSLLARLQINGRMRSKVGASDVVQEAFLGAHRDFGQFRGTTPAEFAGWLRQVLAHAIANQVRRYQATQGRNIGLERQLTQNLAREGHRRAPAPRASSLTLSRIELHSGACHGT